MEKLPGLQPGHPCGMAANTVLLDLLLLFWGRDKLMRILVLSKGITIIQQATGTSLDSSSLCLQLSCWRPFLEYLLQKLLHTWDSKPPLSPAFSCCLLHMHHRAKESYATGTFGHHFSLPVELQPQTGLTFSPLGACLGCWGNDLALKTRTGWIGKNKRCHFCRLIQNAPPCSPWDPLNLSQLTSHAWRLSRMAPSHRFCPSTCLWPSYGTQSFYDSTGLVQ